MIEEQRVVRVLLGIPIVEVRQRSIVPLEEILRDAEFGAKVGRQLVSCKRHLVGRSEIKCS